MAMPDPLVCSLVNRLVRTRMLGGVGKGRLNTRPCPIRCILPIKFPSFNARNERIPLFRREHKGCIFGVF